jgi:hypothetical protein
MVALESRPLNEELYGKLAAPFDSTFHDTRGGVELEYITGEQAVTRLNEVLGVAGWSFRVVQHGFNEEADEIWVLAELHATIDGNPVVRQQFGSQKVKRSRSSGSPLDIGFDFKGATTDALKKCASLIGVGLYLSRKEAPPVQAELGGAERDGHGNGRKSGGDNSKADVLTCAECGEELKETRFKDGSTWTPLQLAGYGRRKHGRVLCMPHYREANESARRTPKALEEIPF